MKVKRKPKLKIPTKYLLLTLTIVCVLVMMITTALSLSGGPLNTIAGYVFVPMQKGINSIGSWVTDRTDTLKSLRSLMEQNEQLKAQVDQLTTDLTNIELDQYELDNLRELLELSKKYPNFEKTGARVIGKSAGNWFNTFLIDKGSDDGIEKDMNVIAGSGLVGIVIDVGKNNAKVRAVIDDGNNISGMTLSSSDNCIVNGNLQTMNEHQVIEFSGLKIGETQIEVGEQIITSNISDKYLQGILIGYVQTVERDANNLTCSGTITPAVDFEHLKEVMVITTKKNNTNTGGGEQP